MTVVQSQLQIQVDGPPWMLDGKPAYFQCTFDNPKGDDDIIAVSWRRSDLNIEHAMTADLLLEWNFRDGTFSGPEESRMTCIKQSNGVYLLNITEVSLNQDESRYWCFASTFVDGAGENSSDSFVSSKYMKVWVMNSVLVLVYSFLIKFSMIFYMLEKNLNFLLIYSTCY